MKITFIVPRLHKAKFSGGIHCILMHANGLQQRGHDVTVIAFPKSEIPEWIDIKARLIIPKLHVSQKHKSMVKNTIAIAANYLGYISKKYNGEKHYLASIEQVIKHYITDCDITIATLWESARVVAKYGRGKKAYFCQHYEPLFYKEKEDQADVEATYHYGLNLIANSSWLKQELEKTLPKSKDSIILAQNGIDTNIFCQNSRKRESDKEKYIIKIISYGGRDAEWKGFVDMAKSVAIARKSLPHKKIIWNVYGDALIPPNNEISEYTSLGFLSHHDLAKEYSKHDILLSASWYESFPLFPIEAMACGLGVITTKPGTEDFAENERNCLFVEPSDPDSTANAIIRLANNRDLLEKLQSQAAIDATHFNWEAASDSMERAMKMILEKP